MLDAGAADDAGSTGVRVEIQHRTLHLSPARCRRILEHVVRAEGVRLGRITLVLADHATVHDLNRRYLNHDYRTDVLAFDLSEDARVLEGEIYVDLDTARERCGEFDAEFEEEALRYAVHGLLHLLGYSDETPEGSNEMHARENRYLKEFG